jgi:DNA polymerase phi
MAEKVGSSSKFMNWFWDLASDEDARRCMAGTMIIKYVIETQQDCENTLSTDASYTLKRLVRGLSSSRDSARQGFSACLCQFLKTFPQIDTQELFAMIDENTKVIDWLTLLSLKSHL